MYGRYVYIEPPQGLEPPPIDTKAWLEERGLDDEVVRLAAAVCVCVCCSLWWQRVVKTTATGYTIV